MKIPQPLIELLEARGVSGEKDIGNFLFPKLKDLPAPELLKNLPEAAHLIAHYIDAGKKIIVWGDYDVDGTTATALLIQFFKEFGVKAEWHIPNRLKEGYGLNIEWFKANEQTLPKEGFLVITVDCGISDSIIVDEIQEMGGEVIVTDHHSIKKNNLPNCLVLNPNQEECGFYGYKLAGVGVAFYLAAGLKSEMQLNYETICSRINLKQYLGFVALGTIADLVELTPVNRILVRGGLEALVETKFIGLKALLQSCGIRSGQIHSEDIGFLIGPRINAAGRLGRAGVVLHLLTEEDPQRARSLAEKLTLFNEERKKLTVSCLKSALTTLDKELIIGNKCIVVTGDIHLGVAGIVASRLVELNNVPVVVFAKKTCDDGSITYIGSARSIENVSIIELFNNCAEFIVKYGGHDMAAGLTVAAGCKQEFEKMFISFAQKSVKKRVQANRSKHDITCPISLLMSENYLNILSKFEPYGPGNEQPVFLDSSACVVDSRKVGRGAEHLNLTFRGKFSNYKGIGFGLGDRLNEIQNNPTRTTLYTPTRNRFRGNVSWQVRVIDI